MPHLDAGTLTDDPKGLEFLAEVLEVSADHPAPCWTASEPDLARPEARPVVATVTPGRKRISMVHVAA